MGVDIRCGVLPDPSSSGQTLIQDFCAKASLSLRPEVVNVSINTRRNQAWDDDVLEAINRSIVIGLDMMVPHEKNETIDKLSALVEQSPPPINVFLSSLEHYIDWFYWPSNQNFCIQYGLDPMYFMPGPQISKQEISAVIALENRKRTENQVIVKEA